jgi:hypothetical protein
MKIKIMTLLLLGLGLLVPKMVMAEDCGGDDGPCANGWACQGYFPGPPEAIPGTCVSQDCLFNVCDSTQTCVGDICYPGVGVGGWTCFAAGTKVSMSDGQQENIEDVVVGDKVVSQDEQGNRSISTVTKLDQPTENETAS